MGLTKPVFVEVDPTTIVNEMTAYYEAQTNKKLQPADVERLLINGFAYREAIIRNAINDTAVQNLIAFASAPVLDYLGQLVGVDRTPAVPAGCTINMTFDGNTTDIVIPEGTRIAAQDQKVFFRTIEAVSVPALTSSATVKALCDTDGPDGNGYAIGQINLIMDPQSYLIAASNSDITAGGSDEESDDRLRDRIKLAPDAFSNAGSQGAYKFFALSANPSIVDVSVPKIPLIPGQVNIFPLIESGDPTPTEILDQVFAACNADNIRPLTDTVVVSSPSRINYTLDIQLTLFDDAIQDTVTQAVTDNVQTFVDDKRKKLGRDIMGSQLISALSEGLSASIYNVVLNGFSDIIVNDQSFAFCTGFTVTVVGLNNG